MTNVKMSGIMNAAQIGKSNEDQTIRELGPSAGSPGREDA
jgi:hypothetical protein